MVGIDIHEAAELVASEEYTLDRLVAEHGGQIIDDPYQGRVWLDDPQRIMVSDGQTEEEYDASSAAEAVDEFFDGCLWDRDQPTFWYDVRSWREAITEAGEIVRIDEATHTRQIDPPEPPCVDGQGHDWRSPHEIVGGIRENPGVWGHGGGVIMHECCVRCGCRRTTDTWAQRQDTGEQGLESVEYEPGCYSEQLADID